VAAHEDAIAQSHPEFLEAYQAASRLSAHVLAGDSALVLEKLNALPRNSARHSKSKGGFV
jgi:hypothetical protein